MEYIEILTFIVITFSIFTTSKSWRNHDFYAKTYGDLTHQKQTRKQSEFFRFATFGFLLFLVLLITIVLKGLMGKNSQLIIAYLGSGLISSIIIGLMKVLGKINFKKLFRTQSYSFWNIIYIFLIFFTACLLLSATILLLKNGITIKDLLEPFK